MIKLIVKLCLVLNPYICLPPIEVIPKEGEISSITSCLMGGTIYTIEINNADYYAKVFCSQTEGLNIHDHIFTRRNP